MSGINSDPDFLTLVVRKRPWMYMRGDRTSPSTFTAAIVGHAKILGVSTVGSLHIDNWGAIFSDTDWLGDSTETMFRRLEPFPEGGVNACRAESITFGFANAMCWRRPRGDVVWAKRPDPAMHAPPAILALKPTFLAFCLP